MKVWPALAALALTSCVDVEPPRRAVSSYVPPPKDEVIPFSSLRLVRDGTISSRHYAIDGVRDIPPEGLDITQTCRINRERGTLYICLLPENSPLIYIGHVGAADRRIGGMRFDMSGLGPPKGKTEVTNITVRLSPQDHRELTPPAQIRPASDAKWERQPDARAIENMMWPSWRSRAGAGRTEARMRCQIQTDLSVICADVRATPEPIDSSKIGMKFNTDLAAQYTSAPTLADGSPAAGAWIEIVILSGEPPLTVIAAPPLRPPVRQ